MTGEEWLKKYTDDSLDIAPDDQVVNELLTSYPFEGGVLYRGLNFASEGLWNRFLQATQQGTVLETGAISSWAKSEATAGRFAKTRPTYYLDHELMAAETARRKNDDHMIGHAGVILKIHLGPGVAIDVTKTDHVKEDEVILPPGQYRTEIHRVETPFMRAITEENFEQELLAIEQGSKDALTSMKLAHILNRFTDFSGEARAHLFKLVCGSLEEIKVEVFSEQRQDRFSDDRKAQMPAIYLSWAAPSEFFCHYEKFLPEDRLAVDRLLDDAVRSLDEQFKEATKGWDWSRQHFHLVLDPSLETAIKEGWITPEFPGKINSGIMDYYRHWNSVDTTQAINSLPDREKSRAVDRLAKQFAHAFSLLIEQPKPTEAAPAARRARQMAIG